MCVGTDTMHIATEASTTKFIREVIHYIDASKGDPKILETYAINHDTILITRTRNHQHNHNPFVGGV